MRTVLIAMALVLLAAACGGSGESGPAITSVASTAGQGELPSSTTTAGAESTTAGDAGGEIDGVPAPDFSLALGDGAEFTLSAEQKPVYMVFWAEW